MTCKQDNTTLMQITCCRGGNVFLLVVDILVYIFIHNNNKKKGGGVKCKRDSAAFPYFSVSEMTFMPDLEKTFFCPPTSGSYHKWHFRNIFPMHG